jgi:peptide/nickel transport system permease protein
VPEQRPPESALVGAVETVDERLVEESIEGGFLGQGAEIVAGAVAAGGEGTRRRQGLGLAAWFAIGWVVFIVAIAVLSKTGILTWGSATESFGECARKGPFAKEGDASSFLLGCDSNGRDMIPRLALGAWTSLLVATGGIIVGFLVGGVLGVIAGYFNGRETKIGAVIAGAVVGAIFGLIIGGVFFAVLVGLDDSLAAWLGVLLGTALGGWGGYRKGDVDTYLTGMFNVLLSVPAIVLALALSAFLLGSADEAAKGGGLPPELVLIIAIGVVTIPLIGRISRASALSWSQREFVLAARAQGAKNGRIMRREVLPNVLPAMFSIALLGIAIAIVAEGTLAILGVGVRPPTPSWGNIIALDRGVLSSSPHIVFEASILIFLTVLALNFLGDAVRSRLDVREGGL